MDELIGQVMAIAKGMWKHKWLGMAVAWVVAIVGAAAVMRVPDKYEASARIYVDTQSILKPLMSGLTVQPNIDQQVSMLSRTLISRPNVEKLIRMADLDLGATSAASRDALIDQLSRTLAIRSTARDNLYTLSFQDSNPDKARRVIQSLVSIFVESSLGGSRKDSDVAKKFINDQIKVYETRLQEAEARLKDFKLRNLNMREGEGNDTASRLGELTGQYEQAKLELREAENARDAARRQLAEERARMLSTKQTGGESAFPTPELDARLELQKRNLDTLLQRFTEQHPDVISARKIIKELEDAKAAQVRELRREAVANPAVLASTSPTFQEMSRVLASAEVQVASLRARVSEYGERSKRAFENVKTAPQIESEFSQLNRDYAIQKKNYEDLVSRRESASLSGDLEFASGVVDFRLIDPPRVTPQPVSPNRMLLIPMVLLVAIGAGAAVTFLLNLLRPVFHDAASLRNAVDLPLLGVVTRVSSDAERARARADLRRFILASGGLVGVFIAGMVVLSMTSRTIVG
jgi:polysaccharide chain length determinant protein (PEP-CTERM system associated)